MLVQLNSNKSHNDLVDYATRFYGSPKNTPKSVPQDTQLIEWQVQHGKWVTSLAPNPLQKDTFIWLPITKTPIETKEEIAQKGSSFFLLLGIIITLIAWYSKVGLNTHLHKKKSSITMVTTHCNNLSHPSFSQCRFAYWRSAFLDRSNRKINDSMKVSKKRETHTKK